jgi:hypothetical protein
MKDFLVSTIQIIADSKTIFNNGYTDTAKNANDVSVGNGSAQGLVVIISEVAMYAIGIVSVIMIIAGGIMYATSAGNDDKIKKAKKFIIGAIVGLIVAVLAWTLATFLTNAL